MVFRAQVYKRVVLSYLSWETACTGLATVVDQTIVSGTSFCLSVIVARKCSKEELGVYVLGLSVIQFMIGFQNSLITMPYVFSSPRPDGKVDAHYAGSTLIHECGLSIVGIVALVSAGAIVFYRGGGPGLGEVTWVLAGVITFILLREYARRICLAWLQPGTAIVVDLLAAAIQIGGFMFLSHRHLLSTSSAYWVTGSACGLAALCWLVSKRHHFHVRFGRVISDLRVNWSFGKWIVAGGLIYTARSELYPWFLAYLHGTAATATFAASMGAVLFANPFFIACSNFLGPKAAQNLANGGVAALRHVVYKTTLFVSVALVLFTVGILFVGERLVVLIYGNQYEGSGAVISVLMLGVLAGAVALGFDAALYAMNRPHAIFQANLLGFGASVLFGFWMAKYYGPLGAAYGLLAANIVTSTSKYLSFSKLCNIGSAAETAYAREQRTVGPKSAPIAEIRTES
jgi:O-antigen/teichoic acid export membrane protein